MFIQLENGRYLNVNLILDAKVEASNLVPGGVKSATVVYHNGKKERFEGPDAWQVAQVVNGTAVRASHIQQAANGNAKALKRP